MSHGLCPPEIFWNFFVAHTSYAKFFFLRNPYFSHNFLITSAVCISEVAIGFISARCVICRAWELNSAVGSHVIGSWKITHRRRVTNFFSLMPMSSEWFIMHIELILGWAFLWSSDRSHMCMLRNKCAQNHFLAWLVQRWGKICLLNAIIIFQK